MTVFPSAPLDFATVDDLCFAAERGRLDPGRARVAFIPDHLGPGLELRQSFAHYNLPVLDGNPWLASGALSGMLDALDRGLAEWINPAGGGQGFIRTLWDPQHDETTWMGFSLAMRRAAVAAGFPQSVARQFDAAIVEMWTNIYDHANAADPGIVAFQASQRSFAFVVSDTGVGILRSLQTSALFASLKGHGEGLVAALTEGASRFGIGQGRGYGFRQMFLSLRSLDVGLRFRSGDHALTLDGKNPNLSDAFLHQKAMLPGFLVSAICHAPPR